MFKKFIAFFTIIIMVMSLMMVTYAESGYRTSAKGAAVFQLIDDRDGNKTFEPQLILSGIAKEGTVITIYHSWYKVGDDESILKKNSDKDASEEGEWVPVSDPVELTIGASGILASTVTLKEGQNKIVLSGKDKDGNKKTETIMIELLDKSRLEEYINNLILKDINIKQ